ncbi:hypothetical protein BDF20DRAFT_873034 [Mycotypha africana]|uniref:uncharacterized protein n=1 Tax=Mycotypha africana TaxID=64632 RepID=UPI0022FFEF6F|nr:uncharacterized protein BDF20DRAFT_873034 [Mycotypha africana]KAI8977119.1 hypothetical protein BDF20DRAFT_873034 [Mycotypha africana]
MFKSLHFSYNNSAVKVDYPTDLLFAKTDFLGQFLDHVLFYASSRYSASRS